MYKRVLNNFVNRMSLAASLLLLIFYFTACSKTPGDHADGDNINLSLHAKILFSNDTIQYEGRIDKKENDASYLYWPGTMVRVRFYGAGIRATLQDDTINQKGYNNYFYVIVDDQVEKTIELSSQKSIYTLAENLSVGEHTVTLFKLNSMHPGYPRGYAKFYNFELIGKGKFLTPPAEKKRKMEFYGNSITCGAANKAPVPTKYSSLSKDESNYWSYGAIIARYFDAQYYCIAKSGVGLIKGTTTPNMAEMYDQINPFDENSHWNFSNYTPDIVIVNLLQNDASHIPDENSDSVIAKYKEFILNLRDKYPQAYIICVLGPMNVVTKPKWVQIVKNAVLQLNDDRVYTFLFDYLGRSGHPQVADDKLMADQLSDFIENELPLDW